ncbi:branched-chain amino acid ABC transporter permease [Eoetvoesiella caeni]|uniref:Amino acid/amide ABC transporter membrane protein 1 (HAAT family) n=1 Tax=Eoetvoesiella caeni TaxID=645616 RepID=A0A366H4U7_9BURK|nr:branched-chain amino acid ABC transporter permease [Eoetvoesiella caeni]MCI2810564.1 branched-chain amino acid ABC transporter permease [Eoetvoesiella caeni]NYT56651.1 branched-chain amino acid ABC transporter permease [Eoetvoesiella caeni]RBP36185.1 amino acid/amide ABC transporter membrane protein 1 (HAAT family) [Eoetvoesiella caeni]
MLEWANTLLQGILTGGVYALFAIGLSLAYGVMKLVNIAHGDFIALAAYIALLAMSGTGLNPFIILPFVVVVMFGLGYLLQRTTLNRALGHDILPPLLITFGMSVIIQNGLLELFSADAKVLPIGDLATASLNVADEITLGVFPLITFITAIAITAGLSQLFKKTTLGIALRATSDDQGTARLMGIKDLHIYGLAMGIAFAVMAVGGVFMGMKNSFTPDVGPQFLIYAFESVVIGGMGSIWGTFAGALLLGVAQGLGYMIGPGWGLLTGHLVFLAVLLFKPNGLFSRTS